MQAIWNRGSSAGHSEELFEVEFDETFFVTSQGVGLKQVKIPARFEGIRKVGPAKDEAAQALQTVDPVPEIGRRKTFVDL